MEIKPKELTYELTDKEITIHLYIDLETKLFTIVKDGGIEHDFTCADPCDALRLANLMVVASQYAIRTIEDVSSGRGWECVTDHVKATITTEIEIGSIQEEPIKFKARDDAAYYAGDDRNSSHSDTNRKDI